MGVVGPLRLGGVLPILALPLLAVGALAILALSLLAVGALSLLAVRTLTILALTAGILTIRAAVLRGLRSALTLSVVAAIAAGCWSILARWPTLIHGAIAVLALG